MKNLENSHYHPHHHHSHTKSRIGSRSMSDTESPLDEFHSPLRSDDPFPASPDKPPSRAIVSVEKFFFPLRSPRPLQNSGGFPPPVTVVSLNVREEVAAGVTKLGPGGEDADGVGGGAMSTAAANPRRTKRDVTVERAALGFRVCEVVLSLIPFSVMASDKTQGWSGDSYNRYSEYRYCVAVNVIAFVYAAFQVVDLSRGLIVGKHFFTSNMRYYFDFLSDQILAYLLISASSSAVARVVDWVSNWGKDEFTEAASAAVGMSFLAFIAFALSSLVSGYNLCCNRNSL